KERRDAERGELVQKAVTRGPARPHDEVGLESDDRFEARIDVPSDDGKTKGLGRVIAEARATEGAVARAAGAERFGRAGGQRDDARRDFRWSGRRSSRARKSEREGDEGAYEQRVRSGSGGGH